MTRSQRFQPIIRLAEHGQDEAARRLGEALRVVEAQRKRLDDLKAYRDGYTRRFDAAAMEGINGMLVQDFRAFIDRINEAINRQTALLAAASQEHETCRLGWVEAKARTGALDKAAERFREEEMVIEEKREQQTTDEHVSRRGQTSPD